MGLKQGFELSLFNYSQEILSSKQNIIPILIVEFLYISFAHNILFLPQGQYFIGH